MNKSHRFLYRYLLQDKGKIVKNKDNTWWRGNLGNCVVFSSRGSYTIPCFLYRMFLNKYYTGINDE